MKTFEQTVLENKDTIVWVELTNGDCRKGIITNVTKENFPKIGGVLGVSGIYIDDDQNPIHLRSIVTIWDHLNNTVIWGYDVRSYKFVELSGITLL